MSLTVQPVPDDYPRVAPYLCVDGAAEAIDFYVSVLGMTERMRVPAPDGKIGHSELQIGDSLVMLSDEYPETGVLGPKAIGGTPVNVGVYVEDVDATFAAAIAAGATELRPVENQFYGDRAGQFEDPWGHHWNVATRVENVDAEELKRLSAEMYGE